MATGVINGSTNSKHITAKVEWSSTPNNAANKSSVTATLFYKKSSSSTATTYGTIKGSITINGTKTDFSKSVTLKNNDTWVQVASATVEGIAHNADGKKSITISAAGGISGTSFTSTDLSANVALDDIPRQATIKSAPNFNDEANPTITYANPAGNVVTSLQACISWTGNADIAYRDISKTGTSYTFNLTSAERTKIRNACANANSMSVTFYVKTVISGVTYYSKLAKTLSIVNATPTLNPTAVEDTDSSTDGGDSAGNIAATGSNTRWLKGISDVRYSFGAAALKGATIKSYKVECGSKKGTSASGVLFDVDSGSIKFTVTDSRGNTATQTLTRTLVNYVKLTCDLKATIALDSGETAKATLKISGNCFNGQIKSGVANSIKVWYRYKAEGGSYGGWTAVTATLSGNSYSLTHVVPTALDYRNNYTFEARAQDDLQLAYGKYITSGAVTVNAKPVFDWGKIDFNFNVPVTVHNGDVGYTHVHSTSGNGISFGVGAGGVNRGIWDKQYSKWLAYTDGTNTYIADAENSYPIGKNKVLWSGGSYMTDTQTASLSEPVSMQMTGIVLVFSRYDTSASATMNEHFSYEFVPKQIVALQEGKGSIFNLATSNGSLAGSKYLYISDNSIKGHANNTAAGTGANGVKYDNAKFVLRYVIGV